VGAPHQNPLWTRALQIASGIKGRPGQVQELSHEILPVVVVEDLTKGLDAGAQPRPFSVQGSTSPAAQFGAVQVFNPVGSGIALDIVQLFFSISASPVDMFLAQHDSPLTLVGNGQYLNGLLRKTLANYIETQTIAQVRAQNTAGLLGNGLMRMLVPTSNVVSIPFATPITLAAGEGLIIENNASFTGTLAASFWGFERTIQTRG
jgi:hypothetical protein